MHTDYMYYAIYSIFFVTITTTIAHPNFIRFHAFSFSLASSSSLRLRSRSVSSSTLVAVWGNSLDKISGLAGFSGKVLHSLQSINLNVVLF